MARRLRYRVVQTAVEKYDYRYRLSPLAIPCEAFNKIFDDEKKLMERGRDYVQNLFQSEKGVTVSRRHTYAAKHVTSLYYICKVRRCRRSYRIQINQNKFASAVANGKEEFDLAEVTTKEMFDYCNHNGKKWNLFFQINNFSP
jgi:hypothetical protein